MGFRPYNGPGGKYRITFKHKGKQYSQVVKTKAKGLEWKTAKLKAIKKEERQILSGLTFSGMSTTYLEDCRARMQPQTVSEKYRHLTNFAEYLGQDVHPDQITIKLAQSFITQIQQTGTNKTANRYLRNLKACWNWHRKQGEQIDNPWNNVESYPEEEHIKNVPTAEAVAALLMAANKFQSDFLHLLLQTAARPGEIRKLSWDDVFFDRRVIVLWTRKRRGGERTPRPSHMTQTMHDILKRLWKARKEGHWVFINPQTGDKYTRQSYAFKYMMRDLCKKAKVPTCDMYSLRHYVGQRVIDSGKAKPVDVQRLLGHKHLTTTDNYIKSLRPDMESLDGVLESILGKNEEKKGQKDAQAGCTNPK